MPLEALYRLMKENKADPDNKDVLDGNTIRYLDRLQLVKQGYFQSNINGIDKDKVTDDVLAFCTLVLSYAKAATKTLKPDQSPKLFIAFMPRTEFNTLFQQVKSRLPGDLFTLFNSLACYKTEDDPEGTVVVDTAFCTGDVSKPISNNKFGALSFTNTASQSDATVNIKDWIEGIGKQSPSPDLLTKFDESIDSSIGGLGTKMEKMYESQRSVPLIEFRDLEDVNMATIEDFMNRVDTSIQKLHRDFADAPKRKRDLPSECTMANQTAGTPTATPDPIVVAPVDPPSQPSCVPSPTGSVKDAHEDELKKAAKYFCDQHATDPNAEAPIDIADTIIAGTRIIGKVAVDMAYPYPPNLGNQDDVFDFSLKSVLNCTPKGGFNLATPVADNQCADILHSTWKNCKNAGRGGEITAGCLVYSVKTKY